MVEVQIESSAPLSPRLSPQHTIAGRTNHVLGAKIKRKAGEILDRSVEGLPARTCAHVASTDKVGPVGAKALVPIICFVAGCQATRTVKQDSAPVAKSKVRCEDSAPALGHSCLGTLVDNCTQIVEQSDCK